MGLLDLMSYVLALVTEEDMTFSLVDLIPTVVILAGAIGLFSDSRWGWGLGMLVGFSGVAVGTWILLDVSIHGGDITLLAAPIVALFFLILPGLLLMVSLATPRTRQWLDQLPRRGDRLATSAQKPDR
jgi:hypothetical protein